MRRFLLRVLMATVALHGFSTSLPSAAASQEPLQDVVHLHDGSVIRGPVVARVPGTYVGIQGIGQWYNGDVMKGFLFFATGFVGTNLVLSDPTSEKTDAELSNRAAIGAILWAGSLVWSSLDAYRSNGALVRRPEPVLYR